MATCHGVLGAPSVVAIAAGSSCSSNSSSKRTTSSTVAINSFSRSEFFAESSRLFSAAASAPLAPVSKVVLVRCASAEDGNREGRSVSRREVFSLATLSAILFSADKAHAKDIPFFGIRKPLEKAEKELKALAAQGGKELDSVTSSFELPGFSLSPTVQAGGVVGAEVLAVLVASTVVNGLVSVPSK